MKVERFVTEYANAKKCMIEGNEFMNPGVKAERLRRIDLAVGARRRGLISADDAIMMIGGFTVRDEDMSQYMTR